MNKILLPGFVFKAIEHKKRNNSNKIYNKIVYCVCIEESLNKFVAHLNIPSDLEFKDTLSIPFTDDSYNLKGKLRVFTLHKNLEEKPICIFRNQEQATHFYGSSAQFTPFRNNYVYSGYIVKIDGVNKFDVRTMYNNISFCKDLVPNIRLKEVNNEYNTK